MQSITEKFDEKLAEIAWSLWSELGVAGTFRRHENCLIMLEELILFTSAIADYDPRLRDEALDWCSLNHHLVSVSRLKALIKIFPPSAKESFSTFAATLNTVAETNWPTDARPFKFKPSGKSSLAPLTAPALLQLRMRTLFGVGARADLFTYFLTDAKSEFTAADAAEIGYSKRSLADLLDSFVQSGFLNSTILRNQRKYSLVKSEQLKRLAGEIPKITPSWGEIFIFFITIRNDLYQSRNSNESTKFIIVRNSMENMKVLSSSIPLHSWESFCNWILNYANAVAHANFGEAFKQETPFERTVFHLLQYIYNVDDCLDGIESIFSCSSENLNKHSKVYKESYQLALIYLHELSESLKVLLEFPFYQLMDDQISDIAYNYSKFQAPVFFEYAEKMAFKSHVNSAREALNQYELLISKLAAPYQFMHALKERLKKIYTTKENVHLLTASPKLHKRHSVINLYAE